MYISMAKMRVSKAVRTIPEANPKGIKSIRRAILFHLAVSEFKGEIME